MTRQRIPATILGGYLGAGKTTLINQLLAGDHGRRIAVLVNDFGAVNIDVALIDNTTDQTISLTNGCVCCSITDDLGSALDEQVRRADPPEHILIEASGVAEPARMASYAGGWPGVVLDATITVADAETIMQRAGDRFVGGVVRRQLEAADLLLLNKIDVLDSAGLDGVRNWLSGQGLSVPVIETEQAQVDAAVLLGIEAARPSQVAGSPLSIAFASAVWQPDGAIDGQAAEQLIAGLPSHIHRIKGTLTERKSGERMLVQKVGARLTVSATSADMPDQLILIGTDRKELQNILRQLDALQPSRRFRTATGRN